MILVNRGFLMQRLAKSLYFRHFQAHTGIFVCMDACWPSHVRDAEALIVQWTVLNIQWMFV